MNDMNNNEQQTMIDPTQEKISTCTFCEKSIPKGNYCPFCGMYIGENQYDKFIKTNRLKFSHAFGNMLTQKKKTSLNWCAILFTPYWFIYRKIYSIGITYLLLFAMIAPAITSSSISLKSMSISIELATKILLGIFANYIYMKHIDSWMLSDPRIEEKSDVNKIALIFSLILTPLMTMLASYMTI